MTKNDFIDLNVKGLLSAYKNPSVNWKSIVVAFCETQIAFFHKNGLLKSDAKALSVPIECAVIYFSDYTEEGQQFLKSGAVDRWLSACDKKGEISAYRDSSGLERRLRKFRQLNI